MTGAFGPGPVRLVTGPDSAIPQQDMDASLTALAELGHGAGARLRVHSPQPTAAFSRLDTLAAGFPAAAAAAQARGFAPVVRPAGGRLAAYHSGALVLDLVAPHPDPRLAHRERFAVAADLVAEGLRALGVDARPGPVPGEYCPGEHSVNAGGRTKLVGTAQRLTRHGYLFSAVVLVTDAEPVRAVLRDTYPLLGLTWDPGTVGCVADTLPQITTTDVANALVPRIAGAFSAAAMPCLPTNPPRVARPESRLPDPAEPGADHG